VFAGAVDDVDHAFQGFLRGFIEVQMQGISAGIVDDFRKQKKHLTVIAGISS
jgi:hypothetical protein